jgi:hypothetical protein
MLIMIGAPRTKSDDRNTRHCSSAFTTLSSEMTTCSVATSGSGALNFANQVALYNFQTFSGRHYVTPRALMT